ncbi:unnamed protein product [Brachionus calyciflorus]|uniref:Calponin-homology (CH) domain-containing protein n=1 Tax=Brachionus calyciflorus TaxID=104777 RepID=A0A813VLY6_9BILA|nr:unnamed protein product [Brachionus calyciflorus]
MTDNNSSTPVHHHHKTRRSLSTLSIMTSNIQTEIRSNRKNNNANNKSLDDLNESYNYSLDDSLSSSLDKNKLNISYDFKSSHSYTLNTHYELEYFNRVNRENLQIDNSEWLAEKPISVLHLDPADRAVLKIADQRDKIQTKTFTKWINQHLKKISVQIEDLFTDLRNGINLSLLLETLTNRTIKKDFGLMRFHWLQNVETCLKFLKDHNIKLVNIRPDEIVDGNPKLTLGLIWIIILHFQISEIVFTETTNHETTAKNTLMLWVNKNLQSYPNLYIKDFSHSWKNGRALLALLHQFIPEKIDLNQMYFNDSRQNLKLAFEIAENEFKVTKLLDPEDVDSEAIDERSIFTYIASLYHSLPQYKPIVNPIVKEKKIFSQDYLMLCKSLSQWLNEKNCYFETSLTLPNEFIELKSLMADLKSFCLEEFKAKQKEMLKLDNLIKELKSMSPSGQIDEEEQEYRLIKAKWEQLEKSIQKYETLIEEKLLEYEQMERTFSNLNSEAKNLEKKINAINQKIKFPRNTSHDDDLKAQINVYEKQIRNVSLAARELQEHNFPNSDLLSKKIADIENMTINILVATSTTTTTTTTTISQPVSPCEDNITLINTSFRKYESNNCGSVDQSTSSLASVQSSEDIYHIDEKIIIHQRAPIYSVNSSPSLNNTFDETLQKDLISNNPSRKHYEHMSTSSLTSESYSRIDINIDLNYLHTNKIINTNTELNNLNSMLDEAFEWIDLKLKELSYFNIINNQQIDLVSDQEQRNKMQEIINEINEFQNKIDKIDLIKMNYSNMPTLKAKSDRMFTSFNSLCKKVKITKESFDTFALFNRLIRQELNDLNQIETTELNRDWSEPNKQNLIYLKHNKIQLENSINSKKTNINYIFNLANKLVNLDHPASEQIKNSLQTLSQEYKWIKKILFLYQIHLENLEKYDSFKQDINYLNNYIDTENSNLDIELIDAKIFNLNKVLNELPSFKLRRMRLTNRSNIDKQCILLDDYNDLNLVYTKGQRFTIEDNSNYLKWNVKSLKSNTKSIIPSICFQIEGPDQELQKELDALKFKFNRIKIDYSNKSNSDLNEIDARLNEMLILTDSKIKELDCNEPLNEEHVNNQIIFDLISNLNLLINKFVSLVNHDDDDKNEQLFLIEYFNQNDLTNVKYSLKKSTSIVTKFEVIFFLYRPVCLF